jgi:FAD/FMN-containing dehydrogenase
MADATEAALVEAPDVAGLQDGFRGQLLRSGDPGYEDARKMWNGSISRFPALIARCAGVADVITAVKFAKDNNLLVAVRGGGHSLPGLSV